ncbi:hypothetical protein Q7C36_006570 [Tachysurus vachellii]|uniref:Uncharacterized protein n=1 Tax=Tachysurus vachellii TaxID=175792 RepID=A0AA88ND06_TACVA|nr:hypothetical protein Q7C36_006570 [Tachysurus vachellii]
MLCNIALHHEASPFLQILTKGGLGEKNIRELCKDMEAPFVLSSSLIGHIRLDEAEAISLERNGESHHGKKIVVAFCLMRKNKVWMSLVKICVLLLFDLIIQQIHIIPRAGPLDT